MSSGTIVRQETFPVSRPARWRPGSLDLRDTGVPPGWRGNRVGRWLGRLGAVLGVVLAAYSLTFFALYALPSDPAALAAEAAGQNADPAVIDSIREINGLDQPILNQFARSLVGLPVFDFGVSFVDGQPVRALLGPALISTLTLALPALIFSLLGGIFLALLSTRREPTRFSKLVEVLTPLGTAVPTFWVGLLLLQFFAFRLRLAPPFGEGSAAALALPTLTLAISGSAMVAQVVSASLRTSWQQPFVEVIRAKGSTDSRILVRHVLRDASGAALSVTAILIGALFSGAVVVESVFARNGLGRLTLQSVQAQDIPVVLAIVTIVAAIVALSSALIEVARFSLDKTVRARP